MFKQILKNGSLLILASGLAAYLSSCAQTMGPKTDTIVGPPPSADQALPGMASGSLGQAVFGTYDASAPNSSWPAGATATLSTVLQNGRPYFTISAVLGNVTVSPGLANARSSVNSLGELVLKFTLYPPQTDKNICDLDGFNLILEVALDSAYQVDSAQSSIRIEGCGFSQIFNDHGDPLSSKGLVKRSYSSHP